MAMTRDQFLYDQLKANSAMYRVLAAVYAIACAAAVVMLFFAYGAGGIGVVITCLGMAGGMAISASSSWSQFKFYKNAVAEIGDDPTGCDTCRTYSRSTAHAIALMRMPPKTFAQQGIAYGVIALMMIGFGVMFICLMVFDGPLANDDIVLFGGSSAFMWVVGLVLLSLSIKAFRNWSIAKKLDAQE